jgi:transcriptional regulator of arginine metabolism
VTAGSRARKICVQGGAFYANPQEGQSRPDPGQILPALLVSVEGAENLLVVKTVTGGAEAVGAAIDQAGWAEIIGTISGVDTVLLVTRGARQRKAVERRLQAYAR